MWPLISSWRISAAAASASSGRSANLTPPAFIRPPVRTCDLMTTGPASSSAIRRASWADFAKPPLEVGIPARATICLDSYSKNRILAARKGSDPALGGEEGWRPAAGRGAGGRTRGAGAQRGNRPTKGPTPLWWQAVGLAETQFG